MRKLQETLGDADVVHGNVQPSKAHPLEEMADTTRDGEFHEAFGQVFIGDVTASIALSMPSASRSERTSRAPSAANRSAARRPKPTCSARLKNRKALETPSSRHPRHQPLQI